MKLKEFERLYEEGREAVIGQLEQKDVLTPPEREILRHYWTNLRPITSMAFPCECGRKYEVDVDLMDDGNPPDEANTSIYVTKVD